jgi:hypothetical protein
MEKKKINLSKKDLNANSEVINDLLSEKGLSKLQGGARAKQEMDWGNSNYSESTRPIR